MSKPHYKLKLEPWQRRLTASRSSDTDRRYVIRNDLNDYVTSLSFRYVCALAAAEAGFVHAVRRRRSWYGMTDEWMEPGSSLFGIGHGTLWSLIQDGLIMDCRYSPRGSVLPLTAKGTAVLAAIRMAGCTTLLTERLVAA